jgi:hypothetical protein
MASPEPLRLTRFEAVLIVDQQLAFTILGGRFSPMTPIDLNRDEVTLSIVGDLDIHVTLNPGLLGQIWGVYFASAQTHSWKADVLFENLATGDWAYSVAIDGFAPGRPVVSITLAVGNQRGTAEVRAFVF